MAFSPLTQGPLSDKYLDGVPSAEPNGKRPVTVAERVRSDGGKRKQLRQLNELAAQRGQTLAQMALAWVLKESDVTSVLIGASRPQQIKENIAVLGRTVLLRKNFAPYRRNCRPCVRSGHVVLGREELYMGSGKKPPLFVPLWKRQALRAKALTQRSQCWGGGESRFGTIGALDGASITSM